MRRKQAGTRERGRYREEEMTAVVEEADDDKKRLLQIIDREGEEEEEEVRCRGWLGAKLAGPAIVSVECNFGPNFSDFPAESVKWG